MPEAEQKKKTEQKKPPSKSKRYRHEDYPAFNVLGIMGRVLHLMSRKEKQKSVLIAIGIVLSSFIELLGLATILPVIAMVSSPEMIQENEYLKIAFDTFSLIGIRTEKTFIIASAVLLIMAFFAKAIIALTLNLYQTRFSFAMGHRLSGLMWQYHFSQSLERMRSTESGRVLSEINGWPLAIANSFVVGNIRFLNECFILGMIAFGLIAYEPLVLLSVALLLGIGAVFIRTTTKNRLNNYSLIKNEIGPSVNTLITNAVSGFLEVMSFRASNAIKNGYLKKTWLLYRINSNSQILKMAPAKLYEVLAVFAVAFTIIYTQLTEGKTEESMQLLVIMALSAYRVMPSMNRLNTHIMGMRSNYHILNIIETGINDWKQNADNPENPNHVPSTQHKALFSNAVVKIKDLTIGYETLDEPVLSNVNCTFQPALIHAIVGPSGSGKSTLVNTILGLQPMQAGTIKIGTETDELKELHTDIPLKDWLANIGYLSQQPFLFNGSVRENLTMRVPHMTVHEEEVNRLIERLDLTDCLGETPLDFELLEGGNNLSGGQQQRLAILRALRIERPVLILDEATSALDGVKRDAVFALLRQRANSGTNVLLITHDMSLAEQCDTVLDLGDDQAQPVQRFNPKMKNEKK